MPVVSLPFLLATAFLSLHVGARSVPDANVFRRVERSGLLTRDPLINSTCQHIRNSVSNESAVYAPGTPEYDQDMGTPRLLFLVFASLLTRLTRQNTGLPRHPNPLRVQSNQAMRKIFLS